MVNHRDIKEPPSSDAETDRMEGMDERDSQLEQMAHNNTSLIDNNIIKSTDIKSTFAGGVKIHSETEISNITPSLQFHATVNNEIVNDKKRKIDDQDGEYDNKENGKFKEDAIDQKEYKENNNEEDVNVEAKKEEAGDDEEKEKEKEKEKDDRNIDSVSNPFKKSKLDAENNHSGIFTNMHRRSLINNNTRAATESEDDNDDEDEDEHDEDEIQLKNSNNVKIKKLTNPEEHSNKENDAKVGIEKENENTEEQENQEDREEEIETQVEDENHEEREQEQEEKESNRVSAMNQLKDIEIKFAQLKDKLYETQLNKLEFELKLCQSNKHPELLEYMKMVDQDFQKKAERLMNLQKYRLKCLDNQTRAYRVALHQQFMKSRQDLKSKEVVKITTDWYDINKERRTMDMQTLKLPNYYQYNETINRSNIEDFLPSLVHQRNSVYKELSLLQGLVDYKRLIPSSLNNLKGCSEEEVNTDLKEMGLI